MTVSTGGLGPLIYVWERLTPMSRGTTRVITLHAIEPFLLPASKLFDLYVGLSQFEASYWKDPVAITYSNIPTIPGRIRRRRLQFVQAT